MRTPPRYFYSAMVLGTVAIASLFPRTVHAQGFTTDDTQLRFDGVSVSPLGATARAGFTSPTTGVIGGIVPIFVYRLPTIAAGLTITSAVLSLNLESLTTPGGINYNVDLYALPFRSTPNITLADFYVGPATTSTSATLIQDDFVLRSTAAAGRYLTNTNGSTSLASFLNAQYAAGAVGGASGNFVLFRLSPDVATTANAGGYNFNTQDNLSTSGLRPTLTITTAAAAVAPEPSSLTLLASLPLLVGVLKVRRRKTRLV